MKKILTASITAAAALALLAGCSGTSGNSETSETSAPKPSASSSAETTANVCTDGKLTVTDTKEAKRALKQGCDTVYLLTSDVELELGAVKTLGIEGNGNTVSVASLGSVYVMGTGNTVTHGGTAPDTKGVAEGNTITAK